MKFRIGGRELDLLTVYDARDVVHQALGEVLRRPQSELVRPEESAIVDANGNALIPIYQVPAGMEFRPHVLNVEADGVTPATPFQAAGSYWQLRVSGRVIDEGSLVSPVDAASAGTTDAPVVAPAAGAALCTSAALAAGFYDVYVSAATGPGAAAADTGNMALQLNGATIQRIPVPANGSDTFGPFRVNVPANGVLRVIAVGVGTAAVPYAASLVALPRAAATAASPANIAYQIPFTRNYGEMQGGIAVNFETLELNLVAAVALAGKNVRALVNGTLFAHPESRIAELS